MNVKWVGHFLSVFMGVAFLIVCAVCIGGVIEQRRTGAIGHGKPLSTNFPSVT